MVAQVGVRSESPKGVGARWWWWWWWKGVGAQLLGCKATLWMHHAGLAPVVAQVGLVAQAWRKLLLNESRNLRQTCATKPTRAKLALHVRQTRVVHPQSRLAPQKLCTNTFPPPPTCITTCAKPHSAWCSREVALHFRRCAPTLFRATNFCHSGRGYRE